MGCDIHSWVEYHDPKHVREGQKPYWYAMGGEINMGRDYIMFGHLAGVRYDPEQGPVVSPLDRMYPDDMSWRARDGNLLRLLPEGEQREEREREVDYETGMRWLRSGASRYFGDPEVEYKYITNPDLHTPTWLTAGEFEKAMRRALKDPNRGEWGMDPGYYAVRAMMRSLVAKGQAVRIIMSFDN